jgi:NAD(P)-dependent dehydrogenase (short-subunit alcohol dehydrogenase family)
MRVCKPGKAQCVIDVNLLGTLNTVEPAIEPLIASRGHAVLVSSLG